MRIARPPETIRRRGVYEQRAHRHAHPHKPLAHRTGDSRLADRPPRGGTGMNEIVSAFRSVTAFVDQHHEVLLLAGLGLTLLLLVWIIRKAVTSERPDKWLATVSLMVGFAWSAEAMWEVATQKMGLAVPFAVFAFFIFESMLAVSMIRAERHYRLYQHPGMNGRAAWLTAVVMGGVAALAGDSPVEVVLRLVVPLLVTMQWWVGMTGDGVTKSADAITWNWSLRRILVTLGLARPGAHDLITVDRKRQIIALAKVSHRLHSTNWRWRKAWCEMRLRRLTMKASMIGEDDDGDDVDDMLDKARIHVERVWRAKERTRPVTTEDLAIVVAARAETEDARTEANLARAAQEAAVLSAQAAHDLAEAQAARTVQVEAQAEAASRHAQAESARADEAQARADEATARADAEKAHRAQAEAEAEAARKMAQAAEARAVDIQHQSEEGRRLQMEAADEAMARARRDVDAEQQKRQQAEAKVADANRRTEEEGRLRTEAEQKLAHATRELEDEQQRVLDAEERARRSREAYEDGVRKVEELTGRLESARRVRDSMTKGQPGAAATSSALLSALPSGQDATAAGGGESQADRASWIKKKIEEYGRPRDEEGWAALTKEVQARFTTVSVRTARRDVQSFKDSDLVSVAP
jgi:hypothetical protein